MREATKERSRVEKIQNTIDTTMVPLFPLPLIYNTLLYSISLYLSLVDYTPL